VISPGTPPTLFRPDISITSADGNPIACIEYQRTPEGFQAFKDRDSVRVKEFPQVIWFFAQGAYNKSGQHRDYLDDRSRTFHRCWVEGETGRLMIEEGRRRVEGPKEPEYRLLDGCSEYTLLRTIDRPEQASGRGGDWINASLDLGTKRPKPVTKGWFQGNLREGDFVRKWSQAEKRHIPGWQVIEIDGKNITVHRPGLPGRCFVPIDNLEPEE